MAVVIRKVQADEEARALRSIGRRSFHPVLSLILPKPRWAYGAFEDGRCLGGVLLKRVGDVGLIDWIFIGRADRGRGLAKQLLQQALEAFRLEGITTVAASVRDDNTASWNLFADRGLRAVSPIELIRQVGLGSALRMGLVSFKVFAYGFDLWVGSLLRALEPRGQEQAHVSDTAPGNGYTTLLWHLGLNLLPAVAAIWLGSNAPLDWFLALGLLILVRLGFAYAGARVFFGSVRLRAARGGYAVAIISHLVGGLLFHPAYWHPRVARWREPEHRSGLGFSALLGVAGMMGITFGASLLFSRGLLPSRFLAGLAEAAADAGKLILIMELQPLFEAWSGPRILRWSPWIYLPALAAGIVLILLA